ncbi:MAG: DegT/DnrJ/EryC1/StrS family aminotransferase [Betaproteobacteria bacterium]|nr:DegT/DnrJ/EryC1/StrS family aminotransferase [Betaproteobacteria bacterium]
MPGNWPRNVENFNDFKELGLTMGVQNPFGKYNGNEADYVLRALDSEDPENKSSPWVQRFEEAFAAKVGAKYAIAVNSGTSGLHAALFAADIRPGDEVIQPAMTVVMDAYATIHLGGIPVFADIDPATQTIDPQDIERKITPRTKAILTVSWQGLPVDMDPIMRIAAKHDLLVIDDSAQTMMGRCKGAISGANAHIGVFSFEQKKHLTTGSEGGMIVSSDETLAVRARKFAGLGYKHMTATAGRTHLALSTVQDPDYERFDTVGLNYRMNTISAAVGLAQLERVDHIVARRQACARVFREAIANCGWMVPQVVPPGIEHTYYTFAVDYRGLAARGVKWKEFYDRYMGMGGDGFYGCVAIPYLEPALRGKRLGDTVLGPGLCPKAEELQKRIMQFKTNYRDLGVAQKKAELLSNLIDEIGR